MATYSEILSKILGRLDSVPDKYSAAIYKVQNEVFKNILPLLDKMELDENGAVIPSASNYSIVAEIEEKLPKILDKAGFTSAIKEFASGLAEQKLLTEALYDTIIESTSYTSLNPVWVNSRNHAINIVGESASQFYAKEFSQAINNAIGSSSTFTDVIKAIRETTTGNDQLEGTLYRYSKQNAKDAFSVTNRKYSEQISRKYGIVFYRYSGANMDTTRPFCLKHHGKIYHEREIESWVSQEWKGKARNTNQDTIFVLVGGYNCGHYLSPVPYDKVPKSYLMQTIEKGWVKREDLPQLVLDNLDD